jgi:hypothetical protein
MTDRELLELAAKAAGMEGWRYAGGSGMCKMLDPSRPETTGSIGPNWSPLTDDGDALRLAVKCRIAIDQSWRTKVVAEWRDAHVPLTYGVNCLYGNREAATRRAIVRAAAEIGKQMPVAKTA